MLSFVADKIRYDEVNFLHRKSDAPPHIHLFGKMVHTLAQRYHRSFHTDQGGEFVNGDLEAYIEEKRITQKQTTSYSPESNDIAERCTQTLSAIAPPAHEHAPPSLWAEANNWACYIKNGLPHSALNRITPYKALYNVKPYISYLRPSYTECYAHNDQEQRPSGYKLELRSIKGRLVGYTPSW